MSCDLTGELIAARRELSFAQERALQEHLATCAACRARATIEERSIQRLRYVPWPTASLSRERAEQVRALLTRPRATPRLNPATLGVALSAALLLLLVAAELLGGTAFPWLPRTQTAGQPAVVGGTPPGTGAKVDSTVYLIEQGRGGDQRLIAYEPDQERVRFDISLGQPASYTVSNHGTGQVQTVYPRDLAIAPDGQQVFAIERSGGAEQLIALSAVDGSVRWRAPLSRPLPHPLVDGAARVLVSPDGSRVFVLVVSSTTLAPEVPRPPNRMELPALIAFDSVTGQQLASPTDLPFWVTTLLPLDSTSVAILGGSRGTYRMSLSDGKETTSLREWVVTGRVLPDGTTLYALTPDLQLLVFDATQGGLRVVARLELLPDSRFFFHQAAFSADGQTLAVSRTTTNPETSRPESELRVFRAGPWREVQRQKLGGRVQHLNVGARGDTIYALMEVEQDEQAAAGAPMPTLSQPRSIPTPVSPDSRSLVLLKIDSTSGAVVMLRTTRGERADLLISP